MHGWNSESPLRSSYRLNIYQVVPKAANLAGTRCPRFPASSVVARLGLRMVKTQVCQKCGILMLLNTLVTFLSDARCSGRGNWKYEVCNLKTGLKCVAGVSLCFLTVCSFCSHILLFFSPAPDKVKAGMLKYPASLGKSTGEAEGVSAGLLALLWLRKPHVLESSHGWGICTVQWPWASVLDSQAASRVHQPVLVTGI